MQTPEYRGDNTEDYLHSDVFLVDVQFDESTRLPIPEQSYYQELLDMPIPLENRIAHLIPYVEPTAIQYTAGSIATKLGVDSDLVKNIAKKIGLEIISDQDALTGEKNFYQTLGFELIEEELHWVQAYRELDDLISSFEIGKFIARHPDWVKFIAMELEVYHTPLTKLPSGRVGYGYPKDLILKLRHILLVFPHAGDSLTVDGLAELTGRKKEWVKHHLEKHGVTFDSRRSLASGRMARHYPWESLDILNNINENEPQPAGDWLSIGRMALMLGKDYTWVESRVQKSYQHLGEIRLTDDRKPITHYPPEVLAALKVELESLKTYEFATVEDVALSALSKRLGHKKEWVLARLPFTTIQSTIKINPANNRPGTYYPNNAEDTLRNLPDDIIKK